MLRTIRKGLNSFLALLLLGILVAVFALWGVPDIFRAPTFVVATVGNRDLTAQEFIFEFQNRVERYQAQLGPTFTQQQAITLGLHQQVLSEMIAKISFDEETEELGLRASDQQVRDAIQDMEAFKNPVGQFSRVIYDEALVRARYTTASFEATIRGDLTRTQLLDAMSVSSHVPDLLLNTQYRFRKEQRRARVMTIPATAVTGIDAPDEETLRGYYSDNEALFQSPEYRAVSMIFLDPADFAEDISITDEDLHAAYDARIDEYNIPEKRVVEVAVLGSEDDANEFVRRVSSGGESFAAVTQDMTGFTEDEVNLGEMTPFDIRSQYNEVAEERIFSADVGAVTQPVATLLGWNVFRVVSVVPAVSRDFETVRDELRRQLLSERGIDRAFEVGNEVDDVIAGGGRVQDIVDETGLQAVMIDRIDRNGRDADGNFVDVGRPIAQFLPRIFSQQPDDELELIPQDDDSYVVIEVRDIFEPQTKPFEDVRTEVQARWFASEQARIAQDRSSAALDALRAGGDFDQIAVDNGGVSFETPLIQRDQIRGQAGVSTAVANMIFTLELNQADIERAATGDGYVIAQLTEIIPGNPADGGPELEALRTRLGGELQSDMFVQYQANIQQAHGVTVNNEVLGEMITANGIRMPAPTQNPISQ